VCVTIPVVLSDSFCYWSHYNLQDIRKTFHIFIKKLILLENKTIKNRLKTTEKYSDFVYTMI